MRGRLLLLLSMLAGNAAWGGETVHERNPEAGLESWKVSHRGVTLELAQITPDQARAFFIGRGFERLDAERYAASCVFTAILRNDAAPTAIAYRLAEWRAIRAGGQPQRLKLKEDWLKEWEARGLAQARKIAFAWSQFPSEQRFEPGDWNQGMLTLMLPRGSRFDLKYGWTAQGKTEEALMKGVTCANDNPGY